MQQQSQELQGLRIDMQLLINLLQGAVGGIPDTSMSGTRNDDRATNSAQTHDIDAASSGLGGAIIASGCLIFTLACSVLSHSRVCTTWSLRLFRLLSTGNKMTTSGPSSLGASKRTKTVVSTSTANAPSNRAQAVQGTRPTPPHVINNSGGSKATSIGNLNHSEDEPRVEGVGRSSGVVPPKEEMYDPSLTRNHTKVSSLGFNEANFYQYVND
ncbi:hypothetical protein Cgig2_009072 [Carnegiea gigantea]|uniref:Uncharacterized protein n=1 Tax=Carnegiea gigantea TaxID=171969 RepID=A0A9Q1GTR3_9CARY|nr:hypothetical protein Cgig2_009072 [Carnegiea gigantea]